MVRLIPCVGCGALMPDVDGPTHRYIGASPGCWQAFGELLARGYGGYGTRSGTVSRLAVDIYAAQHPGVPGKQSSQSVAAHLFVLCLVLERGLNPADATRAIAHFVEAHKGKEFQWMEPPSSLGAVTVLDVLNAPDAAEHERRVRLWAEAVWQAWQPHHPTVRAWAYAYA